MKKVIDADKLNEYVGTLMRGMGQTDWCGALCCIEQYIAEHAVEDDLDEMVRELDDNFLTTFGWDEEDGFHVVAAGANKCGIGPTFIAAIRELHGKVVK